MSDKPMIFTFGDPDPILDNYDIGSYLGTVLSVYDRYYLPPIDFSGLCTLMGANAYHGPLLHFKCNQITKFFIPSPFLSYSDLQAAALDFVVLGNCYFQKIYNGFNQVVQLKRLPASVMRVGLDDDVYHRLLTKHNELVGKSIPYQPGEVIQLKRPDPRQDIYGLPEYFGGIQAVLLSEDSTLFRRKFYLNGAHAGYILLTTDANLGDEEIKQLQTQVKDSKGPGNFRSLYINIPRTNNNQREPVKVIPVGNLGTKDEYAAIKEVGEMEMLSMHRVYPGLAAIIPANVSGFGDLRTANEMYWENETIPMQQVFLMLNEVVGRNVVGFREPRFLVSV